MADGIPPHTVMGPGLKCEQATLHVVGKVAGRASEQVAGSTASWPFSSRADVIPNSATCDRSHLRR